MKFLWPEALWLLAAAAPLAAAYLARARRRSHFRLELSRAIHAPAMLFLLGLVAALLAVARPTAVITLPSQSRTIILAIDVSLSMRAADVLPNRLAAAQAAAREFIAQQPNDVRLGVVSFAGTAALLQQPTRSREDLLAAIDRLQLDRHTAIGSGIVVSLATLYPRDGLDVVGSFTPGRKTDPNFRPVPAGSNPNAAIILLTDGRRTIGPDPLQAARLAAERGVRIYTVGFGSPQGGAINLDGYSVYMMFDEATLKAIAELTNAEYFQASSAAELKKVYEAVSTKFVLQREQTEITAFFALAACGLLALASLLSIGWFNRVF
jgi:Ca-activated chloride channel family protein